MSARKTWYPDESIVIELLAAQATDSGAGSDAGTKNSADASNSSSIGDEAKPAKSKPKITRRKMPTVDTSHIRNESTSSNEKLDTDQCGRGTVETTYSTIENTARPSTKTLLSNLMQCDEPATCKDSDFHGWLDNEPILQWRNIFMPKLEHPTNKTAKDHHRTRRHKSEEYIFQHYKDISEYMKYYRKHCCLTSLSVPSLNQPCQHPKPKENSKQDRKSTRPSTRGVFRTISDDNSQGSTIHHNPKLVGPENTTSINSPSKPLPLVRRPTPASIVNRESTSIVLCGSASSSSEKYYKDDTDSPSTQNKEMTVKSATSTAEGVELPPINNCHHSSSDSSFSPLHTNKQYQHRHALLTDPLVGAEGELDDHCFHNELNNGYDPTLVASSVSVIQQTNSCTKLDDKDETPSNATDESWMYPYPHFEVPSSSRYDKMTREQLLSSKAHALGLLSSKNWTKNKNGGTRGNDGALLTRIRSLPGRIPKELNYMPTLEENLHGSNSRVNSSEANCVPDTIHNRIKTAGAGTHVSHTRPANQSRSIDTSQSNKKPPHQPRATSSRKPQVRNQRVPLASKISHPKRRLSGIHHDRQLSSTINYVGQISERLQGILRVKHENSSFIRNSMVAS